MFVKFVGAMAVIFAGGAAGFYFAGLEQRRARELLEFKKALLILTSEIEYLRTPLAEACANIAKRTDKPVSAFFAAFAEAISQDGQAAYEAWANELEAFRKKSRLTDEDMEALNGFGKTLGYLDAQMQISAINFTTGYIDQTTDALKERTEKTKRMNQSLGWIGGAMVAVLLW